MCSTFGRISKSEVWAVFALLGVFLQLLLFTIETFLI
nr:MAG TPA: hypothetical protein [Caudoviricetes sp.]